MRALLPTSIALAALATGCAATPPPAPPRVVEVAPVYEEPPPPPPKPPPPPTLLEIANRMATGLDATSEAPEARGRGGSSFFGSVGRLETDDVIIVFKVVATSGKFIKDALRFALDVNDHGFQGCLLDARGGERKGTVSVNLSFDKEGLPVEPVLKSSTFKEKNLTECIREGFRVVNPVSHTDQDPSVQANNRATIEISLERPQGF